MNSEIQKLKQKNLESSDVYIPELLRLSNEKDKKRFNEIITTNEVFLTDELYDQLKELIKSRNASVTLTDGDYTKLIAEHTGGGVSETYGVWVYYPWNRALVHTLDKDEFIEVRTSRNKYKISDPEREVLAKKKVGVIGLSVGQSVSVTLAMERACGELRLADFDVLELTNLNRIRTGIKNLGLKKVVSVAREIAEIDPYLKVTCFPEGITEENIDSFITGDGKMDLLIDECDGLDIKVFCRIKAKSYGIPVVMEASDRGTIDIERFDLEPSRSILHGFIDHLDTSKIKDLKTNEEKIPYLLPIAGVSTLSKRARASMVEVGQTITTWPQLASAVALGGGLVTDICRRIFLDEFHDSGRYFIDIEELICDKNKPAEVPHVVRHTDGVTSEAMRSLIDTANVAVVNGQVDVARGVLNDLVQAAILAPTGGNAQPWKWRYDNRNLYLFVNNDYEPKLVDYRNTASLLGLGAATENLVLKAHEMNLDVRIAKFPLGANSDLVSVFQFFEQGKTGTISGLEPHASDDLAAVIVKRTVNRNVEPRQNIAQSRLDRLIQVARSVPGADLRFVTAENDIAVLSDIIGKANRIRVMNKNGHLEFMEEIKWSAEDALKSRKGIDITSLGLTPGQMAGFTIIKDWQVVDQLNEWRGGSVLERLTRKSAGVASAIGLITMPSHDASNFYDGGRAVERVWLATTQDNIAFGPLTVSTFLFNRFLREGSTSFAGPVAEELSKLRSDFQRVFSIDDTHGEIMMFRIFISSAPAKKQSLRVPVEEVLTFD